MLGEVERRVLGFSHPQRRNAAAMGALVGGDEIHRVQDRAACAFASRWRVAFRALRALVAVTMVAVSSVAAAQAPQAGPGRVTSAPGVQEPAATPEESVLDLSTPRRALAAFLARAREGDWEAAALVLDLSEVPSAQRHDAGVAAARHLEVVLSSTGVVPTELPDEPQPGGENAIEIARVPGIGQGVVLRRVYTGGQPAWKFSASTVRAAEQLADRLDRGPIGNRTPEWLREPRVFALEPWQWIGLGVVLIVAVALARVVGRFATATIGLVARRFDRPELARFFPRLRLPFRFASFLAFLGALASLLRLSLPAMQVLGRLYVAAWLLTVGWGFWRTVDFIAERIEERAASRDDWRARGVRTRAVVIRRVLHATGAFVVIAVVLLQFDPVRELGVSLLASAGFVGIIVGIAAQRTLGNALAGIQLSFAQPLRVGDQILIEKEFGTVEEINLSYVVLRLWDHRRLILPIQYLLDTPFENWTRLGTDLVGAVLIPVDFATPIDRVRSEIERFVSEHPLFDGATLTVQVTDLQERTATLRVLVSSSDAGRLFDLRCEVREFILGLLQRLDGGAYLPRIRVEEGTAPASR